MLNKHTTMKINLKITQTKEFDVKTILVKAKVRYWEDATVDGVEDKNGDLIPCREGKNWCPTIDVDSGIIKNWKQGVASKIHYKVCNGFMCNFVDENYNTIQDYEGYVPNFMCPKEEGYGDYIIMDVNADGKIVDWNIDELERSLVMNSHE